jgi:hypothetical protein
MWLMWEIHQPIYLMIKEEKSLLHNIEEITLKKEKE